MNGEGMLQNLDTWQVDNNNQTLNSSLWHELNHQPHRVRALCYAISMVTDASPAD